MKEFKNAVELLTLCTEKNLPISEIMRQREIILGETTAEDVAARMARVLEIMKDAAFSPIEKPVRSMGGLIGGEAKNSLFIRLPAKVSAETFWTMQSLMPWLHLKQMLPWD